MRERGSNADWFLVECLIYYGRSQLRAFAYVRRKDGFQLPARKFLFFLSPPELRNWLEQNHEKQAELWVGFYKKESGRPSVTYSEALHDALCFGWIDGVRRFLYARKAKSKWRAVNVERVGMLIAADRMHPARLKALERATDNSRVHSCEERNAAKFAARDEKTFPANKAAWEFFQSRPAGYRRTTTF